MGACHESFITEPRLLRSFTRLTGDDRIPVLIKMHLECTRCGHVEDDTYKFDVPPAKAKPDGRVRAWALTTQPLRKL
jgi:hypothetical protein